MKMKSGDLVMHGKIVKTALPLRNGLQDFIDFLETVKDDKEKDMKIVLTAHNCFNFDAIVLLKNLKMFGLQLPNQFVFGDTVDLMKISMKKGFIPRGHFSLDACLSHYFNEGQGAHEADPLSIST